MKQQVSDMWNAVSSHLFLLPTASEWHCTFCKRHSHHILSYDEQQVSNIAHFVKGSSSHLFLWPTASESHCIFCERQSHHLLWQLVSHIAHFVTGSLIFSYDWQLVCNITHLWKAHHTFSYHQQRVCDIVLWKAVSSHLFFFTNSKWALTLCILWKVASSHPFLWPTASKWHCTFCDRQSHHNFPMTNSKWVKLHIVWKAVPLSHHFHDQKLVSDIAHFVKAVLLHDQQGVSDIALSVKGNFITSSIPMTNSKWVILHIS